MEIERKFKIKQLPDGLGGYPSKQMVQAYLCTAPVVRVRQEGDAFFLTYKGGGMLAREEYNLPLDRPSFLHLLEKADGTVIHKRRYLIPLEGGLTAELDCFEGALAGLRIVEVEFPDLDSANGFVPPEWFGEEVTYDPRYHNSAMSQMPEPESLCGEETDAAAGEGQEDARSGAGL